MNELDASVMSMKPGQLIRFHARFDKIIHAECEVLQQAVAVAVEVNQGLADELEELSTGLKYKESVSYTDEWARYVRFTNH